MRRAIKSKDELIKEIKHIKSTIRMANDYLEVWRSIKRATKEDGFEKEINIAPGFFNITTNALISSLFIEISKLFDKSGNKACSIPQLLNSCAQSLPSMQFEAETYLTKDYMGQQSHRVFRTGEQIKEKFQEDIKLWKEEKKSLDSVIENIRTQRHGYYAHIDRCYMESVELLMKEAPISFSDIEKIVKYANKVYSGIEVYLTKSQTMLCAWNSGDLSRLLSKMHDDSELLETQTRETTP